MINDLQNFFEHFLAHNPDYLDIQHIEINFTRSMIVARYEWGYIIETECIDEEGVTTLETLVSKDGIFATLLNRERFGNSYNDMCSYMRDSHYPVGCVVRLKNDA